MSSLFKYTLPRALVFLAVLIAVQAFSASTVSRKVFSQPDRWLLTFEQWYTQGFFRSGGVLFQPPGIFAGIPGWGASTDSGNSAYGSVGPGLVMLVYPAQYVVRSLTGHFSTTLEHVQSQIFILIGSFCVGMLGFNILKRQRFSDLEAGLVAISAAVVFQNLRHNLHLVSEFIPEAAAASLFAAIFYATERIDYSTNDRARRRLKVIRGVLSFLVSYGGSIAFSGTLVIAWGLAILVGLDRWTSWRDWIAGFLVPVAAGFALFQGQMLIAHLVLGYPVVGTDVLYRMGLDGNQIAGVGAHHHVFRFLRDYWGWKGLFTYSLLAFAAFCALHRREQFFESASWELNIVAIGIGTYVISLSVFSQYVIIHPYLFDLFILV
jgi:hypothetical protein